MSTKSTIDYFDRPELSHSDINAFLTGGASYCKYRKENKSKKDYFDLGSITHCRLFEPDEYGKRYKIIPSKVGGMMGTFIETLVELESKNELSKEEAFQEAYSKSQFKYTLEKVLSNLSKEENQAYYNLLKNLDGRTPIDKALVSLSENMLRSVYKNKSACWLLNANESFSDDGIKYWNELEVYWIANIQRKVNVKLDDVFNINCKSKLDRVILDSTNKRVVIVDFKTTGKPIKKFGEAYKEYGYYRQLAFYLDAFKWYLENYSNFDLKGYTFEAKIIVCESFGAHQCKVFNVVAEDLKFGKSEYEDALLQLDWHVSNNIWEERLTVEGSGEENISLYPALSIK